MRGYRYDLGRLYALRLNPDAFGISTLPHRHPPPVETLEAPAGEELVAGEAQLFQGADGHFFAQVEARQGVRTPVHAREVASYADVRGELVELSSNCQVSPLPGLEGESVRARLHGLGEDVRFVEAGLEHGRTGAGDRRMAGRIGGVR